MANFNKVLFLGNVTRDPQLSYLPSQVGAGVAVCEFGLAVNRKWTGKDGEKKSDVCFIDCRAFGKSAETLNKYVKKGDPVFIEGRLDFDTWEAQDGSKRSKHRVTIENFQFLGSGQQEAVGKANPDHDPSGQHPDDDIPF